VFTEVKHCAIKLCEERRLARDAPSVEAAEVHWQKVMLYKAQFKLLRSRKDR
jgi:hypothetical protein